MVETNLALNVYVNSLVNSVKFSIDTRVNIFMYHDIPCIKCLVCIDILPEKFNVELQILLMIRFF